MFSPEQDDPSAKKDEIPDDVRGFFDVVRGQVGIELEPITALIDAIRVRTDKGYSARHVGGEVDARTWPAEFRESPERMAIYRLHQLGAA